MRLCDGLGAGVVKLLATGAPKGVADDLGEELARRVGVPFEPVGDAGVPALIGGAKSGEWDVALAHRPAA